MDPRIAKIVVVAACVAMVVIRAPHGQRSRGVKVVKNRRGTREVVLLTIAWIGFFVPMLWVAKSVFAFADYPLEPVPLVAGTLCIVAGLWLFHRSHADLGTNWSITLQVREGHRLVIGGVYRRIRHPMYSALLLCSAGQALVLPNWIAGPSYLVAMTLIVAFRLGPEERMMLEEFGAEYEAYRSRTKRLVPGTW